MNVQRVLVYFLLIIWSIFQAGCGARLPQTLPVAEDQQKTILARYQSFRTQDCKIVVDADISLDFNSFGRHLKASGFLQLQPPSLLRATIVDQVGRPLFILVASDDAFTLVNSMQGEALKGSFAALLRDRESPVFLQPEDVIALLTGTFSPEISRLLDMGRDKQSGSLVWLTFSSPEKNRFSLLFDPALEKVLRLIIQDDDKNILLDTQYTLRVGVNNDCSLPMSLQVTGDALGGEMVLRYDIVMLQEMIPLKNFELTLPEHYIIRELK